MNGASSSEDGPTNLMKESKKPKYTKFTQQELPACKPLLTPGWVMATFMVVGIIFIPIGAVTLLASNSVVEVVHRNDQQLRGDEVSSLDSCKPLDKVGNQTIVPCGLIAWSLFNDTYSFTTASGGILVEKTGIAWKSDVQSKFGSDVKPLFFPNNDRNGSLGVIGGAALDPNKPLRDAEDLIVWMRTAALPNFRKLWGRINQQLEANQTVTVGISNVYNTYTFKGSKKLVLSTTSWLGGKNSFLGIAYLTVGLICMFLALVFFLIHLKNPRPLGDTSYLSWNRKNASNNSRG
uniref:ALA-interacting subunit n=1 Tax=Physcomitrium patens TaxID=3218 RepID=A0A7I4DIY3_PHYPA